MESYMCGAHEAGRIVPHYYTIEDLQALGNLVRIDECTEFSKKESRRRTPQSLMEYTKARRAEMRPESRERIQGQIQAAADQAEVDRMGSLVSCKRKNCHRSSYNGCEGELCCRTCEKNTFLEVSQTIFGKQRSDGNKEQHGPECKRRWNAEWAQSAYQYIDERDERGRP